MGLLHTLSTIDTQESKLGMRLVLEVLAKLMVGENSSWEFPKVGVRLILEMCLILETGRYIIALVLNLLIMIRAYVCYHSNFEIDMFNQHIVKMQNVFVQ